MIDNDTLPETDAHEETETHETEAPMSAVEKLAAGSPDLTVHTDDPGEALKGESFGAETSNETDLELDNSINQTEVVVNIASVDFPTPFFHTSNPDGTRNAVMLSELKEYIDSLQ